MINPELPHVLVAVTTKKVMDGQLNTNEGLTFVCRCFDMLILWGALNKDVLDKQLAGTGFTREELLKQKLKVVESDIAEMKEKINGNG